MIGKPCITALQNSNVPDYADQCCLDKREILFCVVETFLKKNIFSKFAYL